MPRFSGRMGDRGVSIVTLIALPPKHIHQMTGSEGHHGHYPEAQHDIEHRNMVSCADVPEVHEDDAQTVEGVEDNRTHKSYLGNTHEGSLVGTNDRVVCLRADANKSRVQDVDEKE